MDGFELNKIAGAVLGSLLVILGINKLMNAVYGAPPHAATKAYVVEGIEAEGHDTQTAAATPTEAPKSLNELLAAATPEAGKRVAAQCVSCHTFEKGGPRKIGPNLWNIVGGPFAHKEDFPYSPVFQKARAEGRVWTDEELFAYLESPSKYMPQTAMNFIGLKKPEQRAAIIAYLHMMSDNPPPPK